jgi:tetratricopeptide (TPR) repeat protein
MSIINQALKKAQRDGLLRQTQGVRHLVHLRPARRSRRWSLATVGGTVVLGAGAALYTWLTTAAWHTPVAANPPVATRPPTLATSLTPTVPDPAMPWPQTALQQPPTPVPAAPRVPSAPAAQTAGDKFLLARVEDAQPRPAPAAPRTLEAPPSGMSRPVTASGVTPTGFAPPERVGAQALFNRALASQEAGEPERALTLLQHAVALDPTLKMAYNSLGNLYYQQAQYQQAVDMYEKALAIDPDYAKARNNLGNTYMRLAMDDRALVELHKALQADSTYGLAYYNLACVYARADNSETAAQYLQQAIALEPQARLWAQTDDDFAAVRTTPVMQKLLGP